MLLSVVLNGSFGALNALALCAHKQHICPVCTHSIHTNSYTFTMQILWRPVPTCTVCSLCPHAHVHTQMHMYTHIDMHMYTHRCTFTHTRMCMYTHGCACTHTLTCTRSYMDLNGSQTPPLATPTGRNDGTPHGGREPGKVCWSAVCDNHL